MKALDIIKLIRGSINHLAVAVAVAAGTWLAAGTALAAPANDDFANAIDLTGVGSGQTGTVASGTQTGTNNALATLEGSEPATVNYIPTGTMSFNNTVWFKWTCPADGNLSVKTLGSTSSVPDEYDAVLGIYNGASVGALTPLGGSPLDNGVPESMTVAVTAGATYHIQVAGYESAVAANILLTWSYIPGPANDFFVNAIDLTGVGSGQSGTVASGTQTGTDNVDATLEVGEPVGSGGTNTVWFKWTSPAAGNLTVNTSGSTTSIPGEWDAVLGIYTGASVGALTPLGGSPQDAATPENMTVAVTAGTTYFIQTAGWEADVAANILLTWNFVEPAPQADILAFGPGAVIGPVVDNVSVITWPLPPGTNPATLAPTFTLSPGATCKVGLLTVNSGDTVSFSGGPVVFTVTAQGASPIVNNYTVTAVIGKSVLWNVAGGGDWDLSTANWFDQPSGPVTTFANGDAVTFNNTAGGTINIPSAVQPFSTTVSAASGTYTFSGGPIATGSLTKDGAGTLTLASANTYTGATVVNGGTLGANGKSAVGGSTSFSVADGANLLLSGTTAGAWPAAPAATLTGAGTVTIPLGGLINIGFNFDMSAFTGVLDISNGMMVVYPYYSPNFVSPTNGTIRLGNQTQLYLGWGGYTLNTTVELKGASDIEGNGVLRADGPTTLNGAVILGTNSTIGGYGGPFTINAVISDGGNGFGFTKVVGGSVVLTATNTYTGPTIVNDGTLQCNLPAALGSGALSINGSAKLNLNYTGTKTVASVTLGGTLQTAYGTYGSSTSGADFPSAYFEGSGTVRIDPPMFITSFGTNVAGSIAKIGPVVSNAATIAWTVPSGTTLATLAPTFTLSPGTTCSERNTGDLPTPNNFGDGPVVYTVTNGTSSNVYTVTATVATAVLWNVAGGGVWDEATTANWLTQPGGVPTTFANGNEVTFNNTAGGTIAIDPGISPLSTAVSAASGTYTFSGGPIATGSLIKDGDGTLVNNDWNIYSGGTIIEKGTLRLNWPGDANPKTSLGSGAVTLNGGVLSLNRNLLANELTINGGSVFLDNGFGNTLTGAIILNVDLNVTAQYVNHPLSGDISGLGGITMTSSADGGLILSGNNSYAGPTTVTGGTLQCDSAAAVAGGDWIISGGKVNLNYTGTKIVASLTLGGVPKTTPGTYGSSSSGATIQNDSYFTSTGTGTVTIVGGSDYDTWLSGFTFAGGADTTPTGDADGDGLTNQKEYAFGLDPSRGSSVNPITQPLSSATGTFKYTRRATPAATGLTYTVLTSTNLVAWIQDTGSESVVTVGEIETVTHTCINPAVNGKLFVRVQAAPTPVE